MSEIETVDVLVDITENDLSEFKYMYDMNSQFTWTFESEQGHQVNITFRRDPDEYNVPVITP